MRRLLGVLLVLAACPEPAPPPDHTCAAGLAWNGTLCVNVGECAANLDDCDAHATCADVVGGFTCTCNAGWEGDGRNCTDTDECAKGTAECDPNATCTNAEGTYTCTCKEGFSGDGKQCARLPCEDGLAWNGTACVNVGECAAHLDDCDAHATCTDVVGGFTCTCQPGWEGDGRTCTDVDECTKGTAECDPNANCANAAGTYTCTCKDGFSGDGKQCAPVDRCATGALTCGANAKCVNDACVCDRGYVEDGGACVDVRHQVRWKVPDSSTSYCTDGTKAIATPRPNEPAYGQDCTSHGTQPQYEVTADVVRDLVTGLEWQRVTTTTEYTQAAGAAACDALVLTGHDDWRLPTIVELQSLFDLGNAWPSLDPIAFENGVEAFHWSSTLVAQPEAPVGTYWFVSYRYGHTGWHNTAPKYIRCVR